MQTRPRLRAWEQPWVRSIGSRDPGHRRHVRLPAAAVLEVASSGVVPVLLVPDLGTNPVAGYRTALNRLLALRRAAADKQEPLLVVVTRGARQSASDCGREELLRRVAARGGEPPLRVRILPWPEPDGPTKWSSSPDLRRTRQVDQVLGLVARHPLLTRAQLAGLLGTTRARIARLRERSWWSELVVPDRRQATAAWKLTSSTMTACRHSVCSS